MWEAEAERRRTAVVAPVEGGDESNEAEQQQQDNNEDPGGLAMAQGILRAAEVTLPTGDLANGAYDSLGNYYALPEWIVSDPINVAEDSRGGANNRRSRIKGDDDVTTGGEASTDEPDEDEAERRREEKGKGVAIVKDLIQVRARLSENARDVIIGVSATESIRSVARKIAEEAQVRISLPFVTPPPSEALSC